MEVFVLIVLGGVAVAIGFAHHNKKVNEAWTIAASKLRLNYSGGPGGRRMKGQHADIALDVRTESAGKVTLTSYSAEYPNSLPFPIRLRPQTFLSNLKNTLLNQIDLETGNPVFDSRIIVESKEPEPVREFLDKRTRAAVTRLVGRFDELEINERRVEVKHRRLISSADDLVEDLRVLENATRDLWTSAMTDSGPKPVPPPLPKQSGESELEEATGNFEPEKTTEQSVVPLPDPGVIGEARNQRNLFELDEQGAEIEPPKNLNSGETATSSASIQDQRDSQFAQQFREVFSECQSRYAMTKQFDAELKGIEIDDHLPLLGAEPFSMDKIFGRGPGIRRRFSLEKLPDGNELLLVADTDNGTTLSSLRSRVGKADSLVGTLVAFDPFAHTLFLRTARQEDDPIS